MSKHTQIIEELVKAGRITRKEAVMMTAAMFQLEFHMDRAGQAALDSIRQMGITPEDVKKFLNEPL